MGKPSRTKISKSSDNLHATSSKKSLHAPMNSYKKGNKMKRNRRKHRKSIQKLFDNLRNESVASLSEDSDRTLNNTVINLDDTVTETPQTKKSKSIENGSKQSVSIMEPCITVTTINDVNETVINTGKCPSDSKTAKNNESLTSTAISNKRNTSPKHSSTPISNKRNASPNGSTITPKSKKIKGSPMHSSTPLSTKKPSTDDLNISSFRKSNNNLELVENLNSEIANLTKEINRDSYLTIDLTNETVDKTKNSNPNTVIDLVNTSDTQDCTLVSISNASLSMSGDSDVTVLNLSQMGKKKENKMKVFAEGIAKLNASEKGRLLEMITQKIMGGCAIENTNLKDNNNQKHPMNQHTGTPEDSYIKELILGRAPSSNSFGSNIYNPERDVRNRTGLRMVFIDGSNVAMEHGRHKVFSVKGLKICIDYFIRRGHIVKAFVPRHRCKAGRSTDPALLDKLERQGLVVYTPSRVLGGKFISSYDDRYIVQCAAEFDGVIVSGDNYRDLLSENEKWRYVIENRVLPFTWVHDMIMFPKDPLGRNGPTLNEFLKHPVVKKN